VSNFGDGSSSTSIEKFGPDGAGSVFASGFSEPAGMAFDAAANLWVADFGGAVLQINSAGVATRLPPNIAPVFGGESDIVFDTAGNMYIADFFGVILKYTPAGQVSTFANVVDATQIAFDRSGNLFVASSDHQMIEKITPEGVVSTFATIGGFGKPDGLAFDSSGQLYVGIAHGGSSVIERYTSDGVGSLFATLPSAPMYLAFQVPEPSTSALLVAAAACAATQWLTRRRTKRSIKRCAAKNHIGATGVGCR